MNKKRALCLSGGGSFGAFQAGTIKALTEKGISWDIVSGVSVGSLNGSQLAMYPKSKHREAALELEKFWLEDIQGNHSVYKKHLPWVFNYLASLWKGSLYNTDPLLEILNKRFDKDRLLASGIELRIGTVGLRSGLYRSISQSEVTPKWILASASMPVLFSPVELIGDAWVDGGVRNVTPISDILDIPGIEEIDVVLANKISNPVYSKKSFKSSVDVALRCAEVMVDEIMDTDLYYVTYEMEHGVKVNVYCPEEQPKYDAFDFDPKHIRESIEKGYLETKKKL